MPAVGKLLSDQFELGYPCGAIDKLKLNTEYLERIPSFHNNNVSYVLCMVNVYLCSVSGLLNFSSSGLTSFSSFRCGRLVSHISRLVCCPIIVFFKI